MKKPPSYSIGLPDRIDRIYRNNQTMVVSASNDMTEVIQPALGQYNPVDPKNSSLEDKARLNLMRSSKWSPYLGRKSTDSRAKNNNTLVSNLKLTSTS